METTFVNVNAICFEQSIAGTVDKPNTTLLKHSGWDDKIVNAIPLCADELRLMT